MDKKKIEEIIELTAVPGVAEFLSSALEQAKEEFKDQIQQFREVKNKSTLESRIPDLNELSTDKSYFFDLNRRGDPGNDSQRQWVVENFKFKDNPDMVDFLFAEFIQKIDRLEIESQKIKTEAVHSAAGLSVEINFKKTSDTHVGGFVKKISTREEKQLPDESKVIKISSKYKEVNKEEMYQKIIRLMEEDIEFREYIFFHYQMVQKLKK